MKLSNLNQNRNLISNVALPALVFPLSVQSRPNYDLVYLPIMVNERSITIPYLVELPKKEY